MEIKFPSHYLNQNKLSEIGTRLLQNPKKRLSLPQN